MRKLGLVIGGLIVVLIALALIVPHLVSLEGLKTRLVAQASQATGRDVRIDGPVSFAILPSLRIEANTVSIGNVPGAAAPQMASLGKLVFALRVMPLLGGNVVVDQLVLEQPVIDLEVDAQGHPNWNLAPAGATPEQPAPAAAPAEPVKSGGLNLSQLSLDDIRLVEGKVTYVDQRTKQTTVIDHLNAKLSLPSLDQPLAAQGSLVWNDKKIDISLGVQVPRDLMAGKDTALTARISGDPLTVGFKGAGSVSPLVKLAGDVDLNVPSVRGLAAWAGQKMANPGNTFGPLALTGKLALDGKQMSFTEAKLRFDAINASGNVALDTGGARPMLSAKLALDELDLNPYMGGPAAPAPGKPAAPAPAAPAAQAGWSDAPIDFSGLKAADAELQLSLGGLRVQKITIGKSALAVHLKDGRLAADLTQMTLYQGTGSGHVGIDASGAVPAVDGNFKLAGVAAEAILKDAMDIDRLSGTGAFDFALTSRGDSQRQLVGALNGKGGVTFTNGAIKGINLAAMVRNIGSAFLDSTASAQQQTDFAELGGTFTVTNGIVKNDDLALKSPLLRVSGNGTVDLPQRQVNYHVTPTVVANTQGQGAAGTDNGLMVPINITGPLDHPHFAPDIQGLLKNNPAQLLKGLKGGTGTGGGGGALNAVKGLFGGSTP